MTQTNACNQLPGYFSRASSCYIFITIMVQVASRMWPYPQHLRNRRRCVEEWRSSTPDVPAVPLWNSMETLSFIFKQWWLSIQVRTNRSYQTFLTDLMNWTTELLAEDVIWLWKYANVEYQLCMDLVFRFSIPYIQVKRVHMSESGICHYSFSGTPMQL